MIKRYVFPADLDEVTLVDLSVKGGVLTIDEGQASGTMTTDALKMSAIGHIYSGGVPGFNIYASFIIDSVEKWFNPSTGQVEDSDGTISQSNLLMSQDPSVSTLELPKDELSSQFNRFIGPNSDFSLKLTLERGTHIFDEIGDRPPGLTVLEIHYVSEVAQAVKPNRCLVTGYCESLTGEPIKNVKVIIGLDVDSKRYVEYAGNMIQHVVEVSTDENGFWSAALPPSNSFEGVVEQKYVIAFTSILPGFQYSMNGPGKTSTIKFVVPDTETAEFHTLVTRS